MKKVLCRSIGLVFLGCVAIAMPGVPGIDQLKLSQVEELIPMSNLHKPRELIVSFLAGNHDYIRSLYRILTAYNATAARGSELRLVVSVPDNYGAEAMFGNEETQRPSGEPLADLQTLKTAMRRELNLLEGASIPFFAEVLDSEERNPWMQDIGEFFGVRLKGENGLQMVFLDTNYHGGINGASQVRSLAAHLQVKVLNAENYAELDAPNDGDRGGNIEATHEGRVLVGSTISVTLLQRLTTLAKRSPIVVDTSFLRVGHVDEIMAIVPARNECGAALIYADPLMMLNLIWQSSTKYKQIQMASRRESIEYFLKSERRKLGLKSLVLSDFDLTKPARRDGGEPTVNDWTVQQNLLAAVAMQENVRKVQSGSQCLKQVVGIPTVFESAPEFDWVDMDIQKTRMLVPVGSAVNALSLGEHIVITEPFFKDTVLSQLAHIYSQDKIHVVTESLAEYEMNYGSVHCSTNVVREMK